MPLHELGVRSDACAEVSCAPGGEVEWVRGGVASWAPVDDFEVDYVSSAFDGDSGSAGESRGVGGDASGVGVIGAGVSTGEVVAVESWAVPGCGDGTVPRFAVWGVCGCVSGCEAWWGPHCPDADQRQNYEDC